MKTGLPIEVALYHPAEFLELSKTTYAFLDINLEKFKGGVKNQLLVGHIVHYIQNNGLEGIAQFPRYRDTYKNELIVQAEKKGIDLKNLTNDTYSLNWDKAQKLSNPTSVYQSNDPFEKASNVYSSSNYSMFHFLPFNRKIAVSHVTKIVKSIGRNGVISFPLMVFTNCIDGHWKYWIIDGQHRFVAFKRLGFPIRFTLYQPEVGKIITQHHIVQLVADVNNTSRKWNLFQYLKAWESLKVPQYQKLKEVYDKTKISLTTLLQAYSGFGSDKATNLFTDGTYCMEDEKNGDLYVKYLTELKPYMSKSTKLYTALLIFFRNHSKNYENAKMLRVLKKEKGVVLADTIESTVNNLQRLYLKAR